MVFAVVIISVYFFSLLLIFIFSIGQLHLTWHYLKDIKINASNKTIFSIEKLPPVTVQLPVYNEKYVISRLIRAIANFDYPKEKLEIQLLDDSDDESVNLIANEVEKYQRLGLDIKQIRRADRTGFKAGALENGLKISKGELIAIFDADFIPSPDFLRKTIPHFHDEKIGVVQTRWEHLNRNYSLLTKLQAFGLDAHFTVEQTGRSKAGSFINFNGTGGIWRKKCINNAGGWSADTLTEDLDLSYRAQLNGWEILYLEDYCAPAELPIIMPAIKSQQFRWNKGAAETAKKHFKKVVNASIGTVNKLHAFLHLFNSSIFICVFLGAIFSVPMLFVKEQYPQFNFLFNLGSIFLLGFFSIALFYWVAARKTFPGNTFKYFWSLFPAFITVSMGLSLHNSIAVLEGIIGRKTSFIRTPKFNIQEKNDTWKGKNYIAAQLNFQTIIEGLLCIYFLLGIGFGIYFRDFGLIIFHSMLALGFGLVFLYSIKALKNA